MKNWSEKFTRTDTVFHYKDTMIIVVEEMGISLATLVDFVHFDVFCGIVAEVLGISSATTRN